MTRRSTPPRRASARADRAPTAPADGPSNKPRLDQAALLHRRLDKARDQRMRLERLALQLRVELHPDEPGMVRPLDDLGQGAVRAHAGEHQAAAFQRILVVDVDLVA